MLNLKKHFSLGVTHNFYQSFTVQGDHEACAAFAILPVPKSVIQSSVFDLLPLFRAAGFFNHRTEQMLMCCFSYINQYMICSKDLSLIIIQTIRSQMYEVATWKQFSKQVSAAHSD